MKKGNIRIVSQTTAYFANEVPAADLISTNKRSDHTCTNSKVCGATQFDGNELEEIVDICVPETSLKLHNSLKITYLKTPYRNVRLLSFSRNAVGSDVIGLPLRLLRISIIR